MLDMIEQLISQEWVICQPAMINDERCLKSKNWKFRPPKKTSACVSKHPEVLKQLHAECFNIRNIKKQQRTKLNMQATFLHSSNPQEKNNSNIIHIQKYSTHRKSQKYGSSRDSDAIETIKMVHPEKA
jgi:hypothetical protein